VEDEEDWATRVKEDGVGVNVGVTFAVTVRHGRSLPLCCRKRNPETGRTDTNRNEETRDLVRILGNRLA
jgi:hypothetical protein